MHRLTNLAVRNGGSARTRSDRAQVTAFSHADWASRRTSCQLFQLRISSTLPCRRVYRLVIKGAHSAQEWGAESIAQSNSLDLRMAYRWHSRCLQHQTRLVLYTSSRVIDGAGAGHAVKKSLHLHRVCSSSQQHTSVRCMARETSGDASSALYSLRDADISAAGLRISSAQRALLEKNPSHAGSHPELQHLFCSMRRMKSGCSVYTTVDGGRRSACVGEERENGKAPERDGCLR